MRNTIKNDDINKVLNDPSIKKESSYYQFGWKYFGPFLLGFTKWLYSKLQDEKIKKVYFFSRDGYMMQWQKGAINFIKKIKNNNIDISNNIELAMPLIKFGKYPSLKDVELFSFFYNTDGIKEYYVSQKGLLEYKPKELLRALSNSVWKTGFMKSVFKIPFPYFYIYSWIRR